MNVRGCRPPNHPASAFHATCPAQFFCDQPIAFALAVLRCCGIDAASLDQAGARGGSFDHLHTAQVRWRNRSRRRDSRRLRSVARVRSGKPIRTLARDPAVSSAATSIPSSKPGHAPTRPLARCSATRRSELRGLVGRVVLPTRCLHRSRPTALLGFYPSQVYSRQRVARHLCRSGPTCRSRWIVRPD